MKRYVVSAILLAVSLPVLMYGCGEKASCEMASPQTEQSKNEKLLDKALELTGKKLSTQERSVVMRMLNLSEEDLIRGLKACTEFSDGQYPTALDHETVIKQTEAWGHAKYGKYDNLPADLKKEIEEKMHDTFFMTSYYKRLIKENKAPVYYSTATLSEPNPVLVRWKLSKNKYRVIYTSLKAETVTTKKLAELEKASTPTK